MTKLYWADVTALEEENLFHRLYDRADADRKARIDALRFPADKARSLGAWLLLEAALKEWGYTGEIRFCRNEYGKPFLKDGPYFSLSHSGSRVLCAVSDREVGCDLQHMGPRQPKAAERYFADAERAWLRSLPEEEWACGFYRLWTLKESFVKAVGMGLFLSMRDFSLSVGDEIRINQSRFPDRDFFFREWDLGTDYRCACCAADGDISPPEERKLL